MFVKIAQYCLFFLCILSSILAKAQHPTNQVLSNEHGKKYAWGEITLDLLKEEPFSTWYQANYDTYKVDTESLKKIKMPSSIEIFMGTWCGDSRQYVPALIKILKAKNFDMSQVKVFCLNNDYIHYKQAPFGEDKDKGLHRIPLMIFKVKGKEVGRIVESPKQSLEKDLAQIMKGKKGNYTPKYPIAFDLSNRLAKTPIPKLQKMKDKLVGLYTPLKGSDHELKTLGRKLWANFRLVEAEFVYEINALLFPNVSTFATLAHAKRQLGKYQASKDLYQKAVKLDPENASLQQKLKEVTELSSI